MLRIALRVRLRASPSAQDDMLKGAAGRDNPLTAYGGAPLTKWSLAVPLGAVPPPPRHASAAMDVGTGVPDGPAPPAGQ